MAALEGTSTNLLRGPDGNEVIVAAATFPSRQRHPGRIGGPGN
jgi:hypothetical protein